MTVIQTFELTKHYRKTKAVQEISFSVEEGQIFGFLGPNGSGKTTTIGMLLGIITPTAGGIRLFGEFERGQLHLARSRIGATLETPNFYPYLSGWQNLRVTAAVKGVDDGAMEPVLELVGLWDRRKDRFEKYSLGMKQRLAIAATLVGDPDLVILDEPANGLDPEGMREIRAIIHRLADTGKTVFVSSHLLWEVERTCTHVAIIKRGRIIHQGSVRDLVEDGTVVELAGGDPTELLEQVRAFRGTAASHLDDDLVTATLEGADPADLNRFLAERGIFVSHLANRRLRLEDVFMELTGESPRGEVGGSVTPVGEDAGSRDAFSEGDVS